MSLQELVQTSSSPLLPRLDQEQADCWIDLAQPQKRDLIRLLRMKNGFYAFDFALHVFPFSMEDRFGKQDLLRWNAPVLWKHAYDFVDVDFFCFAEDVFGYQFCFTEGQVAKFDPETGGFEGLCKTLEEWAALILADFEYQTGSTTAHEWHASNGPLRPGSRIVPIQPFVTREGTYDLSNLYELEAVQSMLARADLAKQIRNVPDGGRIRISPINVPNPTKGRTS